VSALAQESPEQAVCACGCGAVLENVQRARDLIAAGANHRQAAEIMGVSRKYVTVLMNRPPKYLVGHWRAPKEMYERIKRNNSIRRIERREEYDQWALRHIRERFERGERLRLSPHFGAAQILRERDPELYWTVWALREHERAEKQLARNRRILEQKLRREEREPDRSLFGRCVSLDTPVRDNETGEQFLGDSVSRVGDDPADVFEREYVSERLYALLGSLEPHEVEQMGDHELARLREKLLAEGIGPGIVQDCERERLKNPVAHTGSAIGKAHRSCGGKRTRKQQQAVTRDHHVRELPTYAKKAHASLRKAKRAA